MAASSDAFCLSTFQGHTRNVTSVAYSPDGSKVVSGSGDETVRIWDAISGACVCCFNICCVWWVGERVVMMVWLVTHFHKSNPDPDPKPEPLGGGGGVACDTCS